jgi:hypothetical protein
MSMMVVAGEPSVHIDWQYIHIGGIWQEAAFPLPALSESNLSSAGPLQIAPGPLISPISWVRRQSS